MVTWVIYDISDDKCRNLVAKICKRAGLYRVQESVFLGELHSNRLDELHQQFVDIVAPTDSIYLSPMSSDNFALIRTVGKGFDAELIAATRKHLFF